METILAVLGILMIIATALPLTRNEAWWIRAFDFPRLQIAAVIAVVLLAYLLLRREIGVIDAVFLAVLAICLFYQVSMLFPYTVLSPKHVEFSKNTNKESSLSLLFANVKLENRNAADLREIVSEADPDVILTVETDAWWEAQLNAFEQTHPFVVRQVQDNYYGMILYSRLKLKDPEIKFLVQDDIPSIHARVVLPSEQEVQLHCVHPRPPAPTEHERSTERDAELLIVGRAIKKANMPTVMMGDLNDVAWSHTTYLFQKISGLLDPRVGRGFYNSFHAGYPLLRVPLDHFFHSHHFRLVELKRLRYFGSDHFPMFITLSYEPDAERQQQGWRADASDQGEAQEKIEQVS